MELHAFYLCGEVFTQLFVLGFLGSGEGVAHRQRIDTFALKLFEGEEQRGDAGKGFQRLGLQRSFHLGEGEGVVFLLFLFALGAAIAVLVIIAVRIRFILDLVILADRGAGGGFGDFAVVVIILGAFGHLVGRRFLGKHGVKIEDLA